VAEEEFGLTVGPDRAISIPDFHEWTPAAGDLQRVTGKPGKRLDGKYLKAGSFEIQAKTAKPWEFRDLMNGGWGEPTMPGRSVKIHARPVGKGVGTVNLHFKRLVLVAADPDSESRRVTIALLVPVMDTDDPAKAAREEVPKIVEEISDLYFKSGGDAPVPPFPPPPRAGSKADPPPRAGSKADPPPPAGSKADPPPPP
jgi:hypothetical protein